MWNFKTLGLVLVAVLALFAVASAASAKTRAFHSESSSTTITGSQIGTDEFITNAGTVSCNEATYHASQSATTTETVTITPTYTGCTAFGGFAGATINMNGCDYLLHGELVAISPTIDIECNGGGPIIITAKSFSTTKCTATVPQQTGLQGTFNTGINFNNEGGGSSTRDIKITIHLEGIQYTTHGGTGFGVCSNESASNGTYTGEATVQGEEAGTSTQVGIWYE